MTSLPYEKLGAFYLGRIFDPDSQNLLEDVLLYDSKDLTTHAVIIGMTGSGKTGLGIGLLEEALIDGIPILAVDPKGDLPNMLLTFPELHSGDLLPWINLQDALAQGMAPEAYAGQQAKLWREGLDFWNQDLQRIARLKTAADFVVYTPGSTAGRPVSVLRNFTPPPAMIMEDPDLRQERIRTTVTSLLALLGMEADPIGSRDHILLANIFETAWKENRSLDLGALIQAVQSPPFQRIGVMDLEMVYPARDRFGLAMRLNTLLADPGFATWMEGDAMDIGQFLYTPQGLPRAAIFTVSHLSESQRMFFTATLFNELLGWIRTQPGTSSLRAILYMDEIFGFFPPVSNPPSKAPLLTLLKQARAYGLGVVLSTQNPGDLDYKALSNTGTWLIGRLQTDRDRERVMAGLEGSLSASGLNRSRVEKLISGLGKRTFLLHNVHENSPAIFQTRWTLSYLAGPMTREQIKLLTGLRQPEAAEPAIKPSVPQDGVSRTRISGSRTIRPGPAASPPGIDTFCLEPTGSAQDSIFVPAVIGLMDIHYDDISRQIDTTRTVAVAVELEDGPVPLDWGNAMEVDPGLLGKNPMPGANYSELPSSAMQAANYQKWKSDLLRWVRQNRPLVLYHCEALKLTSRPAESQGEFRSRLTQQGREIRDREVEKLRQKYSSRFTTLKNRLMNAGQAVEREQEQAKSSGIQTAISFGSAILGAFLGRKTVSAGSAHRMGTAMKTATRMQKEKMDVSRAMEREESVRQELSELETRFQEDIRRIETSFSPEMLSLEQISIRPKSADIMLKAFGLGWLPFRRGKKGERMQDRI